MLTATSHPSAKGATVHHFARTPPGSWAFAAPRHAALASHVVHHHGSYLWLYVVPIPFAIAALVSIYVWRGARRERARRALAARLGNPDPRERRAVLDGIDDEVLARNSAALFDLLTKEQDVDVLDALAAAVARSRWEPTDDRNLIELRRWVAGSHTRTTASSTPEPEPVALEAVEDADHAAATDDHWAADPVHDEGAAADLDGHPEVVAAGPSDELADFIPRVRALIGGRVERVELALITGTVLKTWSSTDPGSAPEGTERPGGPAEGRPA